ncbi:MAG TPA: hypothetical protein VFA35_11860, partial [Burkholderiaceae bacterium]|nr:hypothetical protein [Burkholderiaceae bacterium]
PRYAQCTACHRDAAFAPHTFDVAAHAHTAFPLTGSHQAVGCALCHRRELQHGVRAFHGEHRECGACHQDVHQGRFDGAGRPAQVGGRVGCSRCHDTAAFAPAAAFDHALWTGYPLDGAHAGAACIGCHQPQKGRGERRLGPAAGRRCADCHRDVHQGQLAQAGATDCARCHDQTLWKPSHFDHQRDSRFLLDKQHRDLACASCHKPYPSASGPVIRYKPLGTSCGDCHQLGSKGGRR